MKRSYEVLTEPFVAGMLDFPSLFVGTTIWDRRVPGLTIHVSRRRMRWEFFRQYRRHGGKLQTRSVTLGYWPEVPLKEARNRAMVEAGKIAGGKITPGRKASVKFEEAFSDYLEHLEANRSPKWLHDVKLIGDKILLPEYRGWPLADLSASPQVIKDFHKRITRNNGPVQANRAMAILRASYRKAVKLNRDLPPELPTSGVIFNQESPRQTGIADWAAWAAAWRAIPSPVRRSFHLVNLLSGMRPGELARASLDLRRRELVVAKGKSRREIRVPLTREILQALKLARGGNWASARRNPKRDKLPAFGHSLRHAYQTTARLIGIDGFTIKLLMAHVIGGDVTEAYTFIPVMRDAMRAAQRKISREIVRRLGLEAFELL